MKTDNQLIAEFMGFSVYPDNTVFKPASFTHIFLRDVYDYNNNWTHLHKVIEKIQSMWEKGHLFKSTHYHVIGNMKIYTPINDVCAGVVEFIKWYNTQKQK